MANNYQIIKSYAQSPEIMERFVEITGSEMRARSYVNSVIIAVANNDQLKSCTPQSIMKAAADAANLGLDVDPRLGEAHLVPYGSNATLIPGWKGMRNMAYNTGKVLYINTNAVYEGQTWVEDQLTGQAHIEGHPQSREAVGYFAYIETKDHRVNTLYMSVPEIHAHKEKYAKGWKRPGSAWQNEFEKMAKKTVLRQLLSEWAELDTNIRERLNQMDEVDNSLIGEDFPDPSEVTQIEAPHQTNAEIFEDLGIEPDPEPEVVEAEVIEVEVEEEEPKTNYPGGKSEYYAWITQGAVPYIGVKDAKKILEDCKDEVDIAWEVVLSTSVEREELNKRSKQKQGKLI